MLPPLVIRHLYQEDQELCSGVELGLDKQVLSLHTWFITCAFPVYVLEPVDHMCMQFRLGEPVYHMCSSGLGTGLCRQLLPFRSLSTTLLLTSSSEEVRLLVALWSQPPLEPRCCFELARRLWPADSMRNFASLRWYLVCSHSSPCLDMLSSSSITTLSWNLENMEVNLATEQIDGMF